MVRGHAETLMPLIARVMDAGKLEFASSTVSPSPRVPAVYRLRVGIAAARGILRRKPSIGLSTLAAYARPVYTGRQLPVVVAIDARHGHVYLQLSVPADAHSDTARCPD